MCESCFAEIHNGFRTQDISHGRGHDQAGPILIFGQAAEAAAATAVTAALAEAEEDEELANEDMPVHEWKDVLRVTDAEWHDHENKVDPEEELALKEEYLRYVGITNPGFKDQMLAVEKFTWDEAREAKARRLFERLALPSSNHGAV